MKQLLWRLYEKTLTAAAILNLPRLAGLLLRLHVMTVRTRHPDPSMESGGRAGRVLILSKGGFLEDVGSVFSLLPEIEIVSMNRRSLKAIAAGFLPREVADNNYRSASSTAQEGKRRYRQFLTTMWTSFDPRDRIAAVVSGNFGYYAERELAAAMESRNIPFVAMHKENLKTPGRAAFWEQIYRERRGPFSGRKILVYNKKEQDLMIRSGVVTPDRIKVVGMPRLDKVHWWRRETAGTQPQQTVLFFSFLPTTGMPFLSRQENGHGYASYPGGDTTISGPLRVAELCERTHHAMVRLARDCPDLSVIIKTKGLARDRESLPLLLGVSEREALPENLSIIHGGSPFSLICDAAVVCGFNSTTLLEAVAAGKPVVQPWYAEATSPAHLPFILDLGNAARKAHSPEELIEMLAAQARARLPHSAELKTSERQILRDWMGNDDGMSREQVAQEFKTILHEQRSRRPGVSPATDPPST